MNKNKLNYAVTVEETSDFEKVMPQYTIDPLPDGESRAKIVGLHSIECQDFNTTLCNYAFEIKGNNGQIIEKTQPVFLSTHDDIEFPYVDYERLIRFNLLLLELVQFPEKRLGSEGVVVIVTEEIDGEAFQYIKEFIPDIDLDDRGEYDDENLTVNSAN